MDRLLRTYRSEAVPWIDNTEIPTIRYNNKAMVNEGAPPQNAGAYNVS
jgi:hypothetical protein